MRLARTLARASASETSCTGGARRKLSKNDRTGLVCRIVDTIERGGLPVLCQNSTLVLRRKSIQR